MKISISASYKEGDYVVAEFAGKVWYIGRIKKYSNYSPEMLIKLNYGETVGTYSDYVHVINKNSSKQALTEEQAKALIAGYKPIPKEQKSNVLVPTKEHPYCLTVVPKASCPIDIKKTIKNDQQHTSHYALCYQLREGVTNGTVLGSGTSFTTSKKLDCEQLLTPEEFKYLDFALGWSVDGFSYRKSMVKRIRPQNVPSKFKTEASILYRGLGITKASLKKITAGGTAQLKPRAVSSWTSDFWVANETFASQYEDSSTHVGIILHRKPKASEVIIDITSTAQRIVPKYWDNIMFHEDESEVLLYNVGTTITKKDVHSVLHEDEHNIYTNMPLTKYIKLIES